MPCFDRPYIRGRRRLVTYLNVPQAVYYCVTYPRDVVVAHRKYEAYPVDYVEDNFTPLRAHYVVSRTVHDVLVRIGLLVPQNDLGYYEGCTTYVVDCNCTLPERYALALVQSQLGHVEGEQRALP